ncbi:hypothetical protein ACFV0L_34780 [Streptosporangium canum]
MADGDRLDLWPGRGQQVQQRRRLGGGVPGGSPRSGGSRDVAPADQR